VEQKFDGSAGEFRMDRVRVVRAKVDPRQLNFERHKWTIYSVRDANRYHNVFIRLSAQSWEWEAVVVIPFLDEHLLMEETARIDMSALTPKQRARNEHGTVCVCYVYMYLCIYMYAYMCTYKYSYMHACMHTYV
jgi:hypothetical protein